MFVLKSAFEASQICFAQFSIFIIDFSHYLHQAFFLKILLVLFFAGAFLLVLYLHVPGFPRNSVQSPVLPFIVYIHVQIINEH